MQASLSFHQTKSPCLYLLSIYGPRCPTVIELGGDEEGCSYWCEGKSRRLVLWLLVQGSLLGGGEEGIWCRVGRKCVVGGGGGRGGEGRTVQQEHPLQEVVQGQLVQEQSPFMLMVDMSVLEELVWFERNLMFDEAY